MNDIETAKKIIAKANMGWIIAPKEGVEPIDIYAIIADALAAAREEGRQDATGKPGKKAKDA